MRYLIAAAVLGLAGTSFAETINVPADYSTIQAAIDAASNGDEILVAPGTYSQFPFPVINPLGKQVRIRASGTPQETIINANWATGILCTNGEGPLTSIEGFMVQRSTGGLLCEDSSPNIEDCVFENNGLSIHCTGGANPTFSGCTITNATDDINSVIYAIKIEHTGHPVFTNCAVTDNHTRLSPVSIYASATFTNCAFSNNSCTDGYGGGACRTNISSNYAVMFTNCTFSENAAKGVDYGGGAVHCDVNDNVTFSGCSFTGNVSSEDGGAIYKMAYDAAFPVINNCVISRNVAGDDGGGVYCYGEGLPPISGTSICGNVPNQISGTYDDAGGNSVDDTCLDGACCTNGHCLIADQDDCLAYFGQWLGEGTTCDDSPCPTDCLGDANGDGEVNVNDILSVISVWGPCP